MIVKSVSIVSVLLERVCSSCVHSDVNIGGNGVGAPDTLKFIDILLPSIMDCTGILSNNKGRTTINCMSVI